MIIDPDEHLEAAHDLRHQALVDTTPSAVLEATLQMAQLRATMAIAGFMQQMAICGHGTRGFCPNCHAAGGPM